ncbi:MAG: galactokinase [Phycisphaerae bacterium]|nr:galactokinase [Phycisphaerae bacterium]
MSHRDRAIALFQQHFDGRPTFVARAPGRVNLIGEHVDYADGFVLPIAIDRATFVAVRPTQASSTFVSDAIGRFSVDVRSPLTSQFGADAWANYVLGPISELIAAGVTLPNVELAIASDVPLGGGLSSSAALEVAVTLAMLAIGGADMSAIDIAMLCQRAEHRFAGTPCGIMDMMTSMSARPGHAILLDCRSLGIEHVPLPSDVAVLVVDSGVRHRLSDGGYAARRAAVEEAARRMGLQALRDATTAMVEESALDNDLLRRARHVTSEIARTRLGAAALRVGDVRRFGQYMVESHASLGDDFGVSVPEVDAIVDAALSCDGVYGARMTGGGFGGSAVVLVKRARAAAAIDVIRAAFSERFRRAPDAFVTGARAGAEIV